jgi:adenylate kinase family enzyme
MGKEDTKRCDSSISPTMDQGSKAKPQPGRRVVVVGTSGSGKSYVAQRLATVIGVPYVCNDAIIWRANWTPSPKPQRLNEFDIATRGDGWTFDGNLGSLKDPEDIMILERSDTLVWLDLPRLDVMRQLLVRTFIRSWKRQPLWHGNKEDWRHSFASRDSVLLWAWTSFPQRKQQYAAIFADQRWSHLRRIRLRSRAAVDRWLTSLEQDFD